MYYIVELDETEFVMNTMNEIQTSVLIEFGKQLSLSSFVDNLQLELFSIKNNEYMK